MGIWGKMKDSWDAFLCRIYDAKATEDLEALLNDPEYLRMLEADELEWQPYPVPERQEPEDQRWRPDEYN